MAIVGASPPELAADVQGCELTHHVLHVQVLNSRQHLQPVVHDESLDGVFPVDVKDTGELAVFHDAGGLVAWDLHDVQLAGLGLGANGGQVPVVSV
ncbi:hypothetical protein PG985_008038 [Apiospora marii]|uniref:DUF2442 domain-containing protein n=1 Tax=Apiospora marii TaxID=335849 RepID=A0ABR1RAA4_9PEZI